MFADHTTPSSSTDVYPAPNISVLWRRLLAALLDVVLLSVLGWIIDTTFGVTHVTGGVLPQPGQTGWTSYTTATTVDWWWLLLLAIGYFFVQEALLGATIGKAIFRLCVIPSSDNRKSWRITLWQALLRNLLRPLETTQMPYAFGVGLLAIVCLLVTKKRQRVGDLLARTMVVDRKSGPSPAYRPFRMSLRVALMLLVLVCFLAFCSAFYYYGRPPLVIEGLYNSRDLLSNTMQSYTLGSPHWGTTQTGTEDETRSTVTYPIHFTSVNKGHLQICDGQITLRWYGFPQGWDQGDAQWHCTS